MSEIEANNGSVGGKRLLVRTRAKRPGSRCNLKPTLDPAPCRVDKIVSTNQPLVVDPAKSSSSRSRSSSLAGYLTRSTRILSRHFWVWPILGAFLIVIVGWWVRSRMESTMMTQLASELQTVLNADVAALRVWLGAHQSNARTLGVQSRVIATASELTDLVKTSGPSSATLMASSQFRELQEYFKPVLESQGYTDAVVFGLDGRVLFSFNEQLVGQPTPTAYDSFLKKVFAGRATMSHPFPSVILLRDEKGNLRAGVPTMFVAAPIKASNGTVVAALGLRIRPEKDFTQILSVARIGNSGETYAFDRNGTMLSDSRFDNDLKSLGLIPDRDDATSVLNLQLRDPGVDLRKSRRPDKPRSELGLTRMVGDAVQGRNGVDVNGYRDYRGIEVMGAWSWLGEYDFGVGTEVDLAEAYQPLYILRKAFFVLFLVLLLCGGLVFFFMIAVERLQARMRKATVAAKQLGQYVLDEELGAGAYGTVYKAHHAMLRRAVAVKLLGVDKTNESTITRFEREVQVTSQLNHPNTVSIYDFGRTPEGVFYYAMEYLNGINLDKLVKEFGPQCEGRVISILRQICGSLSEAHEVGLIHRDIKPANVILNLRGGMADVVKVLDFGLVKAVNPALQVELTVGDSVVGTPLYISPEGADRPDEVDARSDLYSVGAVGYFLLTGKAIFDSRNLSELLMDQIKTVPKKPSERLGAKISDDLENLIMQCLARDPDQRPASAKAFDETLSKCRSAGQWSQAQARDWWQKYLGATEARETARLQEKTLVIAPTPP